MKNYKVADRYARLLLKSTQAEKFEKISHDIERLSDLIKESAEFIDFLNNPVISPKRKSEIVNRLFERKLDPVMQKFLAFLAEKERLPALPSICEVFQQLSDEHGNIIRAKLTSVAPLRDDQIDNILGKLKKHFGKDILIETGLDRNLLGGFTVQVGDLIYDYSIRAQLEKYREAVLSR